MNSETLGEQIARARVDLGMTQGDLAEKLGKGGSERAIQDWENNRRTPHPRTLVRLRAILGMPGDEEETRALWPQRVQQVAATTARVIDMLPEEQRRQARREFIVAFVQGATQNGAALSDDAEIIQDLIGSYLVAGSD